MENYNRLIERLNAADMESRLSALEQLAGLYESGALKKPAAGDNVNNHIHTTYSFSPYSPTKAAYMAWLNGLATAGIMDHDSIAGAREFIRAGEIIGIATTVGFEQRCSFRGTEFEGRRINNPDQSSVAYLAMHGIPHDKFDMAESFLAPYREKRNERNRRMTERLNGEIAPSGISLDFESDILPLSQHPGGSVTERHILFALAGKIIEKAGRGVPLVGWLGDTFNIEVTGKNLEMLSSPDSEYYEYYLLGVLKSQFVERFYIEADDELPSYRDFIALSERLGAVPAYAYLGDVGDSVTGDKKAQKFEDDYLDSLIEFLSGAGFRAITYMPTRNTSHQLERLMALCEKHNMFEICGEDINSPFQSFVCRALEQPEYAHLKTAAWALIGHERAATGNRDGGMFSGETVSKLSGLRDRIEYFSNIGKQ